MVGGSQKLVFPRMPMFDFGAWGVVLMLISIPAALYMHSELNLPESLVLVFLAGFPVVAVGLILGRGWAARRSKAAIEMLPVRQVVIVFFGGQEVGENGTFLPGWSGGCVAFRDNGVLVWTAFTGGWGHKSEDIYEPSMNIRLVRSERVLRHLCYPCLIVDLEDGRRLRFVPMKQQGLQWRSGMTRREMHDVLLLISGVLGLTKVSVDGDERYQK